MHLNELNHRSPVRVFERSLHGGVGAGNIGVVAARAGIGKSAFVTCVAIDNVLQGRKVLHVTLSKTVDHVHSFYEEIFEELARTSNLEEKILAREDMERNTIIRGLADGNLDPQRLAGTIETLRANADFHPNLIVIEGYDWDNDQPGAVAALKELAQSTQAEVWMSMRTPRLEPGSDWHELPDAAERLGDLLSVVVLLQPIDEVVRIRLLKDHDNEELAHLQLDLDPRTLLIRTH